MIQDIIDNEKELQLLFQSLKRAKGFHLYLVQGNNPRLRTEILDSLKQLLETAGITFYRHHLKEPIVSLEDLLPPGFADREKGKAVLVVSGLENSFIETSAPQALLHRLNYARDLLTKKIPVPLVLWLPVGAFKKILTEAHDLWSWRSGTFYFSTPTEMIEGQFQEMAVLREKETRAAIPEKLYRERLVLFTGLLEDLKLRAGSRKTQLQQADVMQQISELHHSFAETLMQPDQRTGLLEKALEFQIQALEIKESILDRVHPDVGRCYGNLSAIHRSLGQLEKALEFQLKDIAILEQVLDKNHPSLATSYNNVSKIYWALGQLEKALEFQLQAIEIREQVLDKNHPDLAQSYNNVSGIYQVLGQLEKALEFQLKDIAISEEILPKNHPSLAASYNNVSLIYKYLNQLEKALEFQLKDITISEQILTKNHPDLAISYHNLSRIYIDMKDFPRALSYAQKAVDIFNHLFPKGHPNLDTALKNLEALKGKLSQLSIVNG
ncbi:MAG: tetratricopeptide repeat protein [Candidatus Aminicenantes bacterium]|nr:MAG: tetratricopeptide repeat protein [Candidatus Aminicenantes bacterium]